MLQVQNVSKAYKLYRRPSDQLRELLTFGKKPLHSHFWALRGVSFSAERGEFVAIVGPNGCGKSTLLQIVSGILQPTTGRVATRGRVAALLELGAGFNPEFTGRENVMINGELLGISRQAMLASIPSIEEFAEIGEFIDRPVKEYSSGMYVRLAFATAINVEPEILIVDEALAVGDAAFANKCIRKFQELRERQVTVLFVSHDMGLVKQLSDRAIFLLNGQVMAAGEPKHVVDSYFAHILQKQAPENLDIRENRMRASIRHGDRSSEITEVLLLDENGEECLNVESGQCVIIRVVCRFNKAHDKPQVGILIRTRIGMEVYGTNTRIEGIELGSFEAGEELTVEFHFQCWLTPQQYSLTVATQHADGSSHDWLDDTLAFDVVSHRHAAGVADLQARVTWQRRKIR